MVANWDFPTLAGAGALRSTANDLLTFLAATMGYTKTPLAPAMAAMLSVRRPTGRPGLEIGLGWHIRTEGDPVIWHNGGTGGYRTFVGYDPKKRVVSTSRSPSIRRSSTATLEATNWPNFILTITRNGDRLFAQATGQGRFGIFPESEKDYFAKVADIQITFEVDAQGRATGLVVHQLGQDTPAKRIQ
jgi:CubicO group peptidase (beta-lactamase class C family)